MTPTETMIKQSHTHRKYADIYFHKLADAIIEAEDGSLIRAYRNRLAYHNRLWEKYRKQTLGY